MRRVVALLLFVLVGTLGLSASTQYVAASFHDPPELGEPWVVLGGTAVYAPWAWVHASAALTPRAPGVVRNAGAISTAAAVGALLLLLLVMGRRSTGKPSTAHGSSRWATTGEVEKAGLLRDDGVVLCQTSDAVYTTRIDAAGKTQIVLRRPGRLVRHYGPEHLLAFAPTRSGKGVGLVVPTLHTWKESVLVYDIKKENWALTAGWRRQFSHVWRFEPTSTDSLHFNPLLEIRKGLSEVKDTQNVADILVDPTGDKETKDHWQTTAHSLLVGAILHVLYAEPDKTLTGVATFLSDPARRQMETLQRMLEAPHLPSGPHPVVAQAAREMLNKSDNELSGVFSTAMSCLGLYRDPLIARSTSSSDFRIADLMNSERPVSLYLVVPPSDLSRTRPLIRLLINQIGRRLTESMEFGGRTAYRHKLLLLLDEFPSLGRLDFFETALAFLAGYGVKCFLIAQSLNQLEKAYGQNNSILDNCHARLTFAANDDKTAKRISDLLGQATEKKLQKSRSGSGFWLTNRSVSEQEYARPLLTPAEVTQLSQDDGILFIGGLLPYRAKKVRYYLDPRFQGRDALRPPDTPDEQAAELLPRALSDWEGLAAMAAPPAVTSPIAAPEALPAAALSSAPAPASAPTEAWSGFFGPPATDAADSTSAAQSDASPPNELPL
jgi:type IV secretion system protein VirD4